MRPCEEGKKCQYSKYDYSEDVECCAIDFDGDAARGKVRNLLVKA